MSTNNASVARQLWPSGQNITYQDKWPRYTVKDGDRWQIATPEQARQIRINELASIYQDRDILCCDSSLVTDLISHAGESRGDLADAFEIDEIEGMYADPSAWDAAECLEWLGDHVSNLSLSDPPHTVCAVHRDADNENRALSNCPDCAIDTDDPDYIDELRELVQEHASDHAAEVYEWWRVSSWLCGQLAKIGEVTINNGYGHWWGRTCTGQNMIMDGTLQAVAAQFVNDADLQGGL